MVTLVIPPLNTIHNLQVRFPRAATAHFRPQCGRQGAVPRALTVALGCVEDLRWLPVRGLLRVCSSGFRPVSRRVDSLRVPMQNSRVLIQSFGALSCATPAWLVFCLGLVLCGMKAAAVELQAGIGLQDFGCGIRIEAFRSVGSLMTDGYSSRMLGSCCCVTAGCKTCSG